MSFLLRHLPVSVLILSLLAIGANQFGLELFYGARFYLGSAVVVLALLLLGSSGALVGVASILFVPRLWSEPQAAVVLLAEVIWLTVFLRLGSDRAERREQGDVVMADILFWIVVAIPLDFLLFGVIANVDLPKVLDLSLLQAVNGSCNAALAYAGFLLILIVQSRRNRERTFSVKGLVLISLLGLTLAASLFSQATSVRQLDRELLDEQLARFRQVALTSAALETEALDEFASLRRLQSSPMDFRVLDARGNILYESNPALFQTLAVGYVEPDSLDSLQPRVAEPMDLLIPLESQDVSVSGQRGYWRYETKDDGASRHSQLSAATKERRIVVVEPARSGIRELQSMSSRAIRQLGLAVLLAALAARSLSGFIARQFPEFPVLPGMRAEDDPTLAALGPVGTQQSSLRSPRLHSGLSELQPLLQALRSRGDVLANLRESYQRSERQRNRLEAEVGRLSIVDPLTGCFNRRELYRRLDYELSISGREDRDLSFVCLEIDHLRLIKDSYGQPVSDEVLRQVALELRNRSRATDFLCRLGPDQFGLVLTACDAASAAKVAQLLRDVVRCLEVRHEGIMLSVTASIGVAVLLSGRDDPDALITRAQSALYRAKAEGRDRIVVA